MPRSFDGIDDYISASPGALDGVGGGAITIVAIVKITDTAGSGSVVYCGNGDLSGVDLEIFAAEWRAGSQNPTVMAASTADNWHLIAFTKPTGTAVGRGHKYVYDTGTWTHANTTGGSHTAGPAATSTDTTQFGRWGTASSRFNGHIACAAVWSREMSDAEIEQLAFSWQQWVSAVPVAGWLLDQSDIGQTVLDWTGGGANQTAITGTDVSASSVSGFGYGHDVSSPSTTTAAGPVAGSGRSTAAAISTTTAAKVAPAVGSSAAVAVSTSTAAKVVAVTGRCTAAAVSRASATKTVAASATTAALAMSAAQATKQVAATGHTAALAITQYTGSRAVTGRTIAIVRSLHRQSQPRPGTGVLARPNQGTLARPYIGIVVRP